MESILAFGIEYTEMGYLLTFVYALILFVTAKLLLRAFKRICERSVLKKGKSAETIYNFSLNIVKVLVYGFLIYLILIQFKAFSSLGTLLLGTSSVFGVALALASQESMSNIVGGFFLAFYQPFRVDDLICIVDKNINGRIKEIGLRHTVVVTFENSEIVIPNSIMNSSIIENKDSSYPFNNFLTLSISYESNIDDAMNIIKECAINHYLVLNDEDKEYISCIVINLGDYGIDLRLSFHTKNASDGFIATCDLRKAIKEKFDESKIVIPYPTHVVLNK